MKKDFQKGLLFCSERNEHGFFGNDIYWSVFENKYLQTGNLPIAIGMSIFYWGKDTFDLC
jgi:hypothetical protein